MTFTGLSPAPFSFRMHQLIWKENHKLAQQTCVCGWGVCVCVRQFNNEHMS